MLSSSSVCCELGGFLDHLCDFKEPVVLKVISLDLSILNSTSWTPNILFPLALFMFQKNSTKKQTHEKIYVQSQCLSKRVFGSWIALVCIVAVSGMIDHAGTHPISISVPN